MPDAMRSNQILLSMHNEELYREQRHRLALSPIREVLTGSVLLGCLVDCLCWCLQNAESIGDPAIEPGRIPAWCQSSYAWCMCHLNGLAPAREPQTYCRQPTAGTGMQAHAAASELSRARNPILSLTYSKLVYLNSHRWTAPIESPARQMPTIHTTADHLQYICIRCYAFAGFGHSARILCYPVLPCGPVS